jgi:hypothetical protein
MKIHEVLRLYDAQVRRHPEPRAGLVAERDGAVLRLAGPFNFVLSWELNEANAEAEVRRQTAYFRSRRESLLWRIYDHDEPKGLARHLANNGFVAHEPGTLMFLDLAIDMDVDHTGNIEVRRIENMVQLLDFTIASDRAFDDEEASRRREFYAECLDDPNFVLFVAYLDGEPVGSARLETAEQWRFGLLFGGGVVTGSRRLGAYRALVRARAAEARRLGLSFLSTEARETSRPILERLGFIDGGRETTWVLGLEPSREGRVIEPPTVLALRDGDPTYSRRPNRRTSRRLPSRRT